MLTLDPILQAAQDSQSRRPLVELLSQNAISDIPFDGNYLTTETDPEQKPNTITHSSGRLCLVYHFRESNEPWAIIRYVYSDENRGFFTIVDLPITVGVSAELKEASLTELANGNIGIAFIQGQYLRYMIVTVEGVVVTSPTTIATYTSSYIIDMPFVIRLANGSYLMVYYHKTVSGPSYRIMRRTASDFTDWSAETECSIGGTSVNNARYNPSLIQITTGNIFLWFEYVESVNEYSQELVNIYYSISSDNGSTWGSAVKVTAYDTYGMIGRHPTSVQKVANQMHLFFNEEKGAILMYNGTTGWCGDVNPMSVTDMTFDDINRKLYAVCTNTGTGTKRLFAVIKVDVDSWTIDDCWNCSTIPAYNAVFCNSNIQALRHHGEKHLIPIATIGETAIWSVALLNGEADTIMHYHFRDYAAGGITANVTGLPSYPFMSIQGTAVDHVSKRLYVFFANSYPTNPVVQVGYIDIEEVGPNYTWNEVVRDTSWYGANDFIVAPSHGYIIVSSASDTWAGGTKVYLISNGSEYRFYLSVTNPGFPYHGLLNPVFLNNKIYAGFYYEGGTHAEKRGLCIINVADNSITYSRPTWATLDEYGLWNGKKLTADDRIVMTCIGGITIFDPATGLWSERFNNTNVPGMDPDGVGAFYDVAYDDETGTIFTGTAMPLIGNAYLVAFNEYGFLKQSQYKIGTFTASWSFGASARLVQGLVDYDFAGTLDEEASIYGFWTRKRIFEYSIMWDKENTEFNLSKYLVRGSTVQVKRSIDGNPASLSFSLSHGQYFDRTNILSLWSIYLRKSRRIVLKFGERVGDVEYWQNQGTFYVDEASLSYQRQNYPVISVVARDRRLLWNLSEITATAFYENDPKTILEDIMESQAGLGSEDMDFPIFDNTVTIYYQWVDATILEILNQLCNRFAYFPKIDVDGKVTARKIAEDNPTDHVYSDLVKVINYTPDDSFSDYTNQIIVIGEGRDFLEVLYNEEGIESFSGSMGWWGKKRKIIVAYSKDYSRRCRYPRIQIEESVKDGPYHCNLGKEYLWYTDPNEKFFIIRVEAPDLVGPLIAFIITWLIGSIICAALNGMNYGIGIACTIINIWIMYEIMQILGTQANYMYSTFARPVGLVRQSFQGEYNDEDFQNEIGFVIMKRMEDPFCYTLDQCNFVAAFEGMVIKLQRNRVRFTKLAHLQDEEGDTLQFIHPVSNQQFRLFVTEITRKFKIPSSTISGDGSFEDEIEGWFLI